MQEQDNLSESGGEQTYDILEKTGETQFTDFKLSNYIIYADVIVSIYLWVPSLCSGLWSAPMYRYTYSLCSSDVILLGHRPN